MSDRAVAAIDIALGRLGQLATHLQSYGETVGLPGTLTLREETLLPIFLLDELDHALSRDQHRGITLERARELAEPYRQT